MSRLYGDKHRELQDSFDSRKPRPRLVDPRRSIHRSPLTESPEIGTMRRICSLSDALAGDAPASSAAVTTAEIMALFMTVPPSGRKVNANSPGIGRATRGPTRSIPWTATL